MKTLFKTTVTGLLLTAFGALSVFAQDTPTTGPDLETLFNRYKVERKGECGKRDNALATGKEIIEKFGSDELNKAVIDYVKGDMPKIEKADADCKLTGKYDSTYKAKQWDEFLATSKEVMNKQADAPVALDILLTHVSTGYDLTAVDKIDKYNAETISYAKQAIQRIESGKVSGTNNWGTFNPFKNKDNALAWMNYIPGYILWFKQNQSEEAIPFFYKATLYNGEPKNDPLVYQAIGTFYFKKASDLFSQYKTKFEANNKTETDETKAMLALARGTADRAIDAYGRALKVASANPKTPADYKKTLTDTLGELYKFRFDGKTEGQDAYVSTLISKPMPDPSTAVTPAAEDPKPTTATTSTTTTTAPSTVNTATTAKPLTTPVKETTTTTAAKTTTTTTKTTTPAKKPVTKKKGTR
jgi:hypothetical protein